ncbi:MAG: hypothetical protein PSX81_09795 [bacterium]|nr:hypothetical protein [bacterium]
MGKIKGMQSEASITAHNVSNGTDDMINLFFKIVKLKREGMNNSGDDELLHKKNLTKVILVSLSDIVTAIEQKAKLKFVVQQASQVKVLNGFEEVKLPLGLPLNFSNKVNQEKMIACILNAPQPELIAYVLFLQIIDWSWQVLNN